MTVTKILGAQSGLQYQGVKDKSEADPRDALTNALFTGEFKRGPYNKPFKVTLANIRAKLGFDPENIQYQAIEDLLKQGVPFVWVMRVNSGGGASLGAIDTVFFEFLSLGYDITVNGVFYETGDNLPYFIGRKLSDIFEMFSDGWFILTNKTSQQLYIELTPTSPQSTGQISDENLNKTVKLNPGRIFSFYLAPNSGQSGIL